ncbi:uncharacterized protein F4812DRAFT_466558 [Daldinia caldariorum]|uniref:uncharacterized protein n=1 Tax=Daldinia caldariorum TaxID=326644 RepID=UPI002007733F|nr:uncharacterized protein F4812DRAFT_466558 [Daldinia caldariorum]KAI1465082.1 hypothetical protein F4812DRAFT_466558 [Daldinia caldariorum]
MDFLDELESMAQVAIQQPQQLDEIHIDDIERWQSIFGYTYAQAVRKIQEHRTDLSRIAVADSHWEIVRAEMEARGYDKEAYEHSCSLAASTSVVAFQKAQVKPSKPAFYLLKLEGPGTDDSGEPTTFCKVSADTKEALLSYLSDQRSLFQPTFVRYSKAEKDLSSQSVYPSLRIDATMPQHRANSKDDPRRAPAQNQYPVWYFFYGTLGDPSVLNRLLGCEPSYRPASVAHAVIKTWGGKYKALVSTIDDKKEVRGQAFLVGNRDQEHCLRLYETDKYDVVRCKIRLDGEKVRGLTFRFIGDVDP